MTDIHHPAPKDYSTVLNGQGGRSLDPSPTEPRTELAFMRGDVEGLDAAEGLALGFTTEEKAARAPILIMLPTVGCIFPSLFIVILAPAALSAMSSCAGT